MKKIILITLLAFVLSSDKQIYTTMQMMDQVMVIDPESMQVEESILTEFSIEEEIVDCMNIDSEMECNMEECIWMEDHCMDMDDPCMDISDEMSCNMAGECEWMMGMCMEGMNQGQVNTPHFIALDEINGYWFVTTIASGFIAQYSLIDNSFIDSYFVGDAPALLVVDPLNKKVYASRMMSMNGMGDMMPSSESNLIQGLSYSAMGFSESGGQEYEINSPAPHGLAINDIGTEIYTASNTADWLYKINTNTGEITGVIMDENVGNPPDQTTQRLKPIQCLFSSGYLFVTCSAGPWMNPFTGEQSVIPGQIQMWEAETMTLIDSIEVGDYTSPWHIQGSPNGELLYVVLSGDNLYETEGLACIRIINNALSLEWITNDPSFDTLHGVDISSNGEKIYVSGRGDGNIHVFDSSGNYVDNVFLGSMSMLGGIAIEKKGIPALGDANNNGEINVVDIVLVVNSIFFPMMSDPYQLYASDFNQDQIINVVDIVQVINLILNIE